MLTRKLALLVYRDELLCRAALRRITLEEEGSEVLEPLVVRPDTLCSAEDPSLDEVSDSETEPE